MAQRATGFAQPPVHLKRNRLRAAKHAVAEAVEDRFALEGEVNESLFARVTADLVTRERDIQSFRLASPMAEPSKAELHKNRFLNSTARLLVYKGQAEASVIEAPPAEANARTDATVPRVQAHAELRRLSDELAALRSTLADRETALAKTALDHEQAREDWQHESQAELSKAEQAWKDAEAARLADAEVEWQEQSTRELADVHVLAEAARDQPEREVRSLRDELAALRSTLADHETALAKTALDHEQAREDWQHESQAAEQAWKAAEAARLAEAEAEWREQSAKTLAAAHAQAEAARDEAEGELRSLRDESAARRSTLADRETALAKATSEHQQAREDWQRESQAAEAARLAEAEAAWREQSATELTEAHAQAEAARDEAEGELRSLRDELAALRSTLADRETALAKAASDHEQFREDWRRGSQAELSKAEQAWKDAEAARLAEAEAKRQEQSARTLADMRAQAEAARNQADGNIRSLQDQLAALQVTLADREAALAKAALDTEQARERGRQELDAALAKAKAWQADEAARFAAAQAEWRKQSANALNEATARYQTAEGMLTQMRMQADRARSDAVGGSTRPAGRAGFGARPAERETESESIRLPTREERGRGTQESQVVIRPKQMMSDQESRAPRKRGAFRDIVVVASLAILVIVAYPSVEPLLPETWRSNIAAVIGKYAPSPSVTVQGMASVVGDVNLRVGPSTTARVITTLPSGLKVATVERRGDWTLVQIEGNSSNTQARQGWVFGSFLKDETGEVEDDVETAPSEESE